MPRALKDIGGRGSTLMTLLVTLALSACVTTPAPDASPRPEPRVEIEEVSTTPSEVSQNLARYYRSTEARLVARGLLRTDGGGPDTPFTAAQLAANFERIALYDEYQLVNGRFVARQTPSTLRRWRAPVRLQPHFGSSVEAGQQAQDRATLSTYGARLSRLTGHPISTVTSGGNYHVLFMNADALATSAPLLRQLVPSINDATIREVQNMGRLTYCSIFAFSLTGTSEYIAAITIVRDEHPDLLRRSCIHEEIAQGLGLPNDSPSARPTIFNDDEEFSLLTNHDELLLRILYDDRLSVGMTPDQARPIVAQITAELVGGPS